MDGKPLAPVGVPTKTEWPPEAMFVCFERGSKDVETVARLVGAMCEKALKPHLGLEVRTWTKPYPEKHRAAYPDGVEIWVRFVPVEQNT